MMTASERGWGELARNTRDRDTLTKPRDPFLFSLLPLLPLLFLFFLFFLFLFLFFLLFFSCRDCASELRVAFGARTGWAILFDNRAGLNREQLDVRDG